MSSAQLISSPRTELETQIINICAEIKQGALYVFSVRNCHNILMLFNQTCLFIPYTVKKLSWVSREELYLVVELFTINLFWVAAAFCCKETAKRLSWGGWWEIRPIRSVNICILNITISVDCNYSDCVLLLSIQVIGTKLVHR